MESFFGNILLIIFWFLDGLPYVSVIASNHVQKSVEVIELETNELRPQNTAAPRVSFGTKGCPLLFDPDWWKAACVFHQLCVLLYSCLAYWPWLLLTYGHAIFGLLQLLLCFVLILKNKGKMSMAHCYSGGYCKVNEIMFTVLRYTYGFP